MSVYRFAFDLTPAMVLVAQPGRHQPCLHGCVLIVDGSHVAIEGPSRDRILDQAVVFLRIVARRQIKGQAQPEVITGVLTTPRESGGGRDGWTITIGADVSISPTSLKPHLVADAGELVA